MKTLLSLLLAGAAALAADPAPIPVGQVLDRQLAMLERELVPLAEAMPAAQYDFAPSGGEFKGVRTFGQQVGHTAAVIYAVAAATLEEKNPSELGPGENGPATLKTKEQLVTYLKDSIAYAHKAMASVTAANATAPVPNAFGEGKAPRLSMATVAVWHSFDHYGQMVVYARMNGIVPPASRR